MISHTYVVNKCIIKFLYFRDSSEVVIHSADAFAPVAYLRFLELHLEDKASKPKIHSNFKRQLRYVHWLCMYNTIIPDKRVKPWLIVSDFFSDPQSITTNFANIYRFKSSFWIKRYISQAFVVQMKRESYMY